MFVNKCCTPFAYPIQSLLLSTKKKFNCPDPFTHLGFRVRAASKIRRDFRFGIEIAHTLVIEILIWNSEIRFKGGNVDEFWGQVHFTHHRLLPCPRLFLCTQTIAIVSNTFSLIYADEEGGQLGLRGCGTETGR